jgi:hypothetical protein
MWGFPNYLKSSEVAFIVAKGDMRSQESAKDTAFSHCGRAIPREKFEQIQKRKTQQDGVSPTVGVCRAFGGIQFQYQLTSYKETPLGILYCSTPRFEFLQPLPLQHVSEEQNATYPTGLVKGDVPLTDSGYKSAPNLDNSPNSQPILEKSPRPFIVDSSAIGGSRGDDDAKTIYSIGTTVDPGYARKYIIELCNDMYSKLRLSIDTTNRSALTIILPELIKAFAIKLCHDAASQTSQMNRETMYFIHKRHR